MSRKQIFWCGILGVTLFASATLLGGLLSEEYHPFSQLISETYAMDTQYGPALRLLGFVPAGILIFLFAWGSVKHFPKGVLIREGLRGFGVFYGLSTFIAGVFPCDYGCSLQLLDASVSHQIHHLAGLVTYIFVPICILIMGVGLRQRKVSRRLHRTSIGSGLLAIFLSTIFLLGSTTNYAGLFQLLLEIVILAWICYVAFFLKDHVPLESSGVTASGSERSNKL